MIAPLVFTVAGAIATKGSTRAFPYRRKDGRIGVRVTSANPRARPVQNQIAWAAQQAMRAARRERFVGPVYVKLRFKFARPDSVTRALPTVKPDLDKLVRLVLDALTGVAFDDDAAVTKIEATKEYDDDAPRIIVGVGTDSEDA